MGPLKSNFSLGVIIFMIILLMIEIYSFQAFRFAVRNYSRLAIRLITTFYLTISLFCFSIIFLTQISDWHNWNAYFKTYSFAILVITIPAKFIFIIFVITDDIVRFFRWLIIKIPALLKPESRKTVPGTIPISRASFIIKSGLVVSSIPFFSMIYGMAFNAYNYKVRRLNLVLPGIPDSFNGFKIVQVSDIHTGSFLDGDPLIRAVRIINEQQADAVFFTGDLVNYIHEEVLPYKEILKKIEAKHGVFSIFGNHDYGDYYKWNKKEDQENDILELKKVHAWMGWKLLWDEHQHIEKNGERITIIGVQNCSSHGFSNYGSLEKATSGIEYSPVNILLSHDPSHWKKEVTSQYPRINLTLSGHTHGMQFGVEIPGFKWSPVQYVYKEWAGLYQEDNQYLYVNRGLGFIGYPGRVGILPEITVIELRKNEKSSEIT